MLIGELNAEVQHSAFSIQHSEFPTVHPILARGGRLALYLGLWLLVSGLLAALLAGRAGLTWLQAALVSLPAALVYAFVCLSAWYVARSLPIKTTGTSRILFTGLVTSLLSSAVWLAITSLWVYLLVDRGWLPVSARGGGHQGLIFGFGVLLYLLSLAVGYLLVMFEESRDAERRATAGPGAGARSRAAVAALAARSALPVQLPPLDQRADDGRSAGGAADVPAAGASSCARRLRSAARAASRGARAEAGRRFLAVERIRFGDRLDVDLAADATPRRAWCRRCCCSRSSRTPSRTVSLTCSSGARSRIAASRRLRGSRSSSRIRAIPIVRDAPAPASACRMCAHAFRRCYGGEAIVEEQRAGRHLADGSVVSSHDGAT